MLNVMEFERVQVKKTGVDLSGKKVELAFEMPLDGKTLSYSQGLAFWANSSEFEIHLTVRLERKKKEEQG